MEKILTITLGASLHRGQFSYQLEIFTIKALHYLVRSEKNLIAKEVALSAFMDIEGAFDKPFPKNSGYKGDFDYIYILLNELFCCQCTLSHLLNESL